MIILKLLETTHSFPFEHFYDHEGDCPQLLQEIHRRASHDNAGKKQETTANEELLSQCASLSRVYITTILESARKIVNQVVELIYYATQVVFQMVVVILTLQLI